MGGTGAPAVVLPAEGSACMAASLGAGWLYGLGASLLACLPACLPAYLASLPCPST
jgi:hypothetical protein